MSLKVES